MLSVMIFAAALVAVTVAVHAAGFGLVIRFLVRSHEAPPTLFWPVAKLVIQLAWLLILIHVAEITVWALFYLWAGCLPDGESAFYFSGVTYTTVGYGDLVLPVRWRMLAPVEALAGILMCGLSAALFFATLIRIYASRSEASR
jgi:hypothetical protein